jgi:hypothetical protein
MVHEIVLIKLKPGSTAEQVEALMVETRIQLLKVPEVINLRCGKRIDQARNPNHFFISIDYENLGKLQIAHDSPIFYRYTQMYLNPLSQEIETLTFEMEPGKDVAYS